MEILYQDGKRPTLAEVVGIEDTRVSYISVKEDAYSNHLTVVLNGGECTFEASFPLGTLWVSEEREKK